MPEAISNTSPLLYLHRIGSTDLLYKLCCEIWIPSSVCDELKEGVQRGYDVPNPVNYKWLKVVNPSYTPSEWLSLDLGAGELAAMALALENPKCVVLLDDMLARRTAQVAGLIVWGTLRILLEAKEEGFIDKVEPYLNRLIQSGMWLSTEICKRILSLANER